MPTKLVDVGEYRLHVVVEGRGPAVLLLHGFPDSAELWRPQISALVLAGFQVVAPDMLGFGRSSKPLETDAYALRYAATMVLQLLDQLDICKPVTVVGHDWGAAVSWRLAIVAPQRVHSLVALSVGHPGGGAAAAGMAQRGRWWYMLFFLMKDAERLLQANNWQLFRDMMVEASPAVQEQYIDALSSKGCLTAALNWYRANVTADMLGTTAVREFPQLQCPVLGIIGAKDTALTLEQMRVSERYVAQGKWQYHVLPRAGHWIQRDAPTELNDLLVHFVKQQSWQYSDSAGKSPSCRL